MEGLMRHTASLAAVLLSGVLLMPASVQGQSHTSAPSSTAPAWVEHAWEEGSNVLPYAIDVNDENEVYVTKVVQDTAYHYFYQEVDSVVYTLGSFIYVQGSFIVRYDADGSLRWERAGSAPRKETRFFNTFVGYGIAARGDRIYTNDGTPRTGNERHISHGGIMINTYADDGDSLRTIFLGEFDDNSLYPPAVINGLGLDQAGNIYIAGMYSGITYSRDSLFSVPHALSAFPLIDGFISELGYPDIFLASYTPEGAIRWTRRIGGPLPDNLFEGLFTVDDDGNTYLGGLFHEGAVFGEGQPNEVRFAPEESHNALVSFTAEGDLRWVHTLSDLGIERYTFLFHRLAVDAAGHLLIGWRGTRTGTASITKLSQDGTLLWGRQLLADNLHIAGITTDARATFMWEAPFPAALSDSEIRCCIPPDHAQPPEEDGFVAHYDADGNLRWAGHATGAGRARHHCHSSGSVRRSLCHGQIRRNALPGAGEIGAQGRLAQTCL